MEEIRRTVEDQLLELLELRRINEEQSLEIKGLKGAVVELAKTWAVTRQGYRMRSSSLVLNSLVGFPLLSVSRTLTILSHSLFFLARGTRSVSLLLFLVVSSLYPLLVLRATPSSLITPLLYHIICLSSLSLMLT